MNCQIDISFCSSSFLLFHNIIRRRQLSMILIHTALQYFAYYRLRFRAHRLCALICFCHSFCLTTRACLRCNNFSRRSLLWLLNRAFIFASMDTVHLSVLETLHVFRKSLRVKYFKVGSHISTGRSVIYE